VAKYKVAGLSEVSIDNSAGTLLNMTQYVETITALGREFASLEVTTFVDSAERFIAGIEMSEEITISGPFDDAATTGPDAVFSTLVGTINTIRFAPAGTASGRRQITGEYLFKSYKINAAVKERVSYELVAQRDGTLNATGTF
jgi:hypothetical protein